ncbi:BRO-N domain-containing protein [Metapseudomonas resinovorans]|uniref:BRO-N domain-containing protein n=1 Tax=Metapseudomonas resinovorans TaxID=53412 RepID=UPI0004918589|nr:BRO family protein [Pseudomonas resinovorans]
MSLPVLFEFETLPVRVLTREDGELWFVASDLATALEYRDAGNMARNLEDDEKGTHIVSTLGGDQDVLIVNEAGLYSAILRSRKPSAQRFKRWVTHEVLPTIRKTGSYQTGNRTAAAARISNHRLRLSLGKELYRTRDPELRKLIHQQLADVSDALGLPTPDIDRLGHATPEAPDVLKVFWEALDFLDGKGVKYNHAKSPNLLAVNLPELARLLIEHGQPLTFDTALRQALWQSHNPRCLHKSHVVDSRISGKSVKCWVFEWPSAE